MTYGEARDKTLQLINSYSLGGRVIESSYNEQQDYLNRIPGLLNDAMMFIAMNIRPIQAQEPLDYKYSERVGGMYRFDLPTDFYEIDTAGLLVVSDCAAYRCTSYTMASDDSILVPWLDGDVLLLYHRLPALLPDKPADNVKLSGEKAVQYVLPYYAAAQLLLQDDAYAYTQLYNEWTTRVAQLRPAPHPEYGLVEDVYGADSWGDF